MGSRLSQINDGDSMTLRLHRSGFSPVLHHVSTTQGSMDEVPASFRRGIFHLRELACFLPATWDIAGRASLLLASTSAQRIVWHPCFLSCRFNAPRAARCKQACFVVFRARLVLTVRLASLPHQTRGCRAWKSSRTTTCEAGGKGIVRRAGRACFSQWYVLSLKRASNQQRVHPIRSFPNLETFGILFEMVKIFRRKLTF